MAKLQVQDESLFQVASVDVYSNGHTPEHVTAADIQRLAAISAEPANRVVSFSSLKEVTALNVGHITEVKTQRRISERVRVCGWTLIALTVFAVAWKLTSGGYKCSVLLFSSLSVYAYSRRPLQPGGIAKHLFYNVKNNIISIVEKERRPLTLMLAYVITKFGIHLFRPKLEKSNGSPLSLILFTVYFIVIFILPPLVQATWKGIAYVANCRLSLGKQLRIACDNFFHMILRWRISISITVVTVVLSYVFDGDLTCMLRYFGHEKSCWPLLIPQSLQDSLPYPLQHAWFKEWHKIFSNYKPPTFVKEIILFGREMEVIHVLPMLIGTYVLTQVLLPRENWIIKKVLFGCISGVVLSGATSGFLKMLLHRYRPNAYGNPFMWTGPGKATVNHMSFSKLDLSFPCGHTTVSTSISACIYIGVIHSLQPYSTSLKMKLFLVMCIYFCPLVVLFSRVSECNHWTSDGIFGVS